MNLEQYFEESEGAFPERGVVGIESEWLEAGNLAVPFGELWAGDLYVMERGGGTVLTVPKGSHRVQVKGMDFKGHRRSSRVRVALATTTEPQITKRFGSTSTDCGMIGVYDVAAFERIVLRSHAQEYKRDLVSAAMRQGMGCASAVNDVNVNVNGSVLILERDVNGRERNGRERVSSYDWLVWRSLILPVG